VATVTESAVYGSFTGLGSYVVHDLVYHDGAMRACWGFSRGHYFGDIVNVALGSKFFVLVLETPRVLP
jgi:hypothetical protein